MQFEEKWIKRREARQKNCEHPEWRRCLTKNDKIIYECVECSLARDKMPKPKPLSQDQWI